jgi:hypothetical protein
LRPSSSTSTRSRKPRSRGGSCGVNDQRGRPRKGAP